MFQCEEVSETTEARTDPRLDPATLRCLPATDDRGSILLIGVVHDHPASLARVRMLLEAVAPDVLALELPPLAVPLFRLYATDDRAPPRLGGEMSLAIQVAEPVEVVGIDGPTPGYVRRLLAEARRGATPWSTLRAALSDVLGSTAQAIASRLGAVLGAVTPIRLQLYEHHAYDVTLLDPPADQADHERSHRDQQRAFLAAIETPPARQFIDRLREETMAHRLATLAATGDVVAVVGAEHLDPLTRSLDGPDGPTESTRHGSLQTR